MITKNVAKITLLISICLRVFLLHSQNAFEIVFDNLEESEIRASIETSDNDFLFVVHPENSTFSNDYILKVSSQGEEMGSLNYKVDDCVLKFFGLFKHPDIDDIFVVPALIYDGQASTEVSILSFDKDLNFIDDIRSVFSDIVQDLAPVVIP